MGESGLQEALFAELAAGAGVRAYGVPSHAGGLPANTGERRGGQKWTNAGIRPIRGWANRRLGVSHRIVAVCGVCGDLSSRHENERHAAAGDRGSADGFLPCCAQITHRMFLRGC